MSSVVLLVDDNAVQASTRGAILERFGYRVAIASSGQLAMERLSSIEMRQNVVLIIADHLMPGMNGPEMVSEIRAMGLTVPVLVLSGLPDAESAYEGLDVTFCMKPCPPDQLVALVRKMTSDRMPRSA